MRGQPKNLGGKQRVVQLYQAGRVNEARAQCRKLCTAAGKDPELWFFLGVMEGQLGNAREAVRAYRSALSLRPGYFEAQYNLAHTLMALGEESGAFEAFARALELNPRSAEAQTNLGNLLKNRGQLEEAIAHHRRATALNPRLAVAHYNLGNALLQAERAEEAVESYQRAVQIDPGYADAYANMGDAFHSRGDDDASQRCFQRACTLSPGNGLVRLRLGDLARARGEVGAAVQWYRQAIAADQAVAVESNMKLGNLLFDAGHPREAVDCFRAVVKNDPNNAEAHNNLGTALFSMGDFRSAIESYRAALAIKPGFAQGFHNLGNALRESGQLEEAEAAYEQALRLNPQLSQAEYMLATLQGREIPDKPPEEYVANLFDQYAWKFDSHLVQALEYHTPELIQKVAFDALGEDRDALNVLDLGCGTGLCGPLFRERARRMVGVDLSAKMIEKARDRNVYDELVVGDLLAPMEGAEGQYDLVLAADVFVYLGALEQVFEAVAETLRGGGLFVFSTEADKESRRYTLRKSGRYAHALSYVEDLGRAASLQNKGVLEAVIRKEAGAPIEGNIFVFAKV
jgi:predicted TPR repeat methyltransferase